MKTYTDIEGNKYTDHSPDNSMEIIESHNPHQILVIEELDYITTEGMRKTSDNFIELYDDGEGGGGVEYEIVTRTDVMHSTENSDYDRSKYISVIPNLWYDLNNHKILIVKECGDQYSPAIEIFSEPEDELKTDEQLAEDGYTTNCYRVIAEVRYEELFDNVVFISKLQKYFPAQATS